MNITNINKDDLQELRDLKQEALETNDLELLEEGLLDLGYDLDYVEIILTEDF